MTTIVSSPKSDSKPDFHRPRKPPTEFEVQWRDPERTLVDYLAAVWSRKLWIGVAMAVTTFVAALYALTRPNIYASQASLLVIGNRSGASAAEVAANMLRTGNIGPSQVLSALEVVHSSVVADRVVERITPAEITKPYQPERASEEERQKMGLVDTITDWMHRMQASWFKDTQTASSLKPEVAAEVFRRGFAAWADERASLIKLVYRAGSRSQAQRILEETVKTAIERYREVWAPEQSREWVMQRVADEEKAFLAAKADYDQFVAQHGRVKFTEEITAKERALAALEGTFDAMRRSRDTTVENLELWDEKLKALPPQRELRDRKTSGDNPTARGELLKERVRIENLIIEAEKTSDQRKAVREAYQAQLENVNRRLAELDEPRTTTIVEDNPEYLAVEKRVLDLRFELAELDHEIPRLESEFVQQRNEVKELHGKQALADQLSERLTTAKTKFDSARAGRDSYVFQEQLDRLGLTSLQRVDDPTLPLLKEGPQRARIILAGAAIGLLLSVTLIMLLVRMSRAFLRTSEVAVCLGRGDVVGMPWLERGNVRRFRLARKKGWD